METLFSQYGGTVGVLGTLLGIWGILLALRSDADSRKAKTLEQKRLRAIQEKLHGDIFKKAILISFIVARIKNNIEYTIGVPDLLKPQIDSIEIEAKNIEDAVNNVLDWIK
jgi:hypothetical protein